MVNIAKKYIGQTEKPGNAGFNSVEFETKMLAVGWEKKQAWCSYFCELVAKEALPNKAKELNKLFSASAVTTFTNFKSAGYTISSTPIEGALVVWQTQKNGKPDWTGHIGIVSKVINNVSFRSIEGNTNSDGGREGYIVADKARTIKKVQNGLQILGFIKID
jgi:hypothetical protein